MPKIDLVLALRTPADELESYEAQAMHELLWEFLRDTGASDKVDFFDQHGFKGRAWPANSCFACSFAQKQAGCQYVGKFCHKCPIEWPDDCYNRTEYFCEHEASPYAKWVGLVGDDEESIALRKRYAGEMVDIQWLIKP